MHCKNNKARPGGFPESKHFIMKTKIYDFDFELAGYGHYKVTYTSPATGKKWSVVTSDMTLVDATKNAEEPKRKDLEKLKRFCKNGYC